MTPTIPSQQSPKALLVVSDPMLLLRLRGALEARGLEVRFASGGESGVRLLLDEILGLDVLVVDLDLDLDGRGAASFVDFVRGAGGERDLPILVAGAAGEPRGQGLLRLGADAIVDVRKGIGEVADAALALATKGRPSRGLAPRRPPTAPGVSILPATTSAGEPCEICSAA
jgi:CheY-like chemotaxis protein